VTKVHESVLVGYFCQAVGWVARDLDEKREPTSKPEQRLLRAINLSHNPLDPAIGDMILQLDDEETSLKEFYVFEFKVRWDKGVRDEHEKFKLKNNNEAISTGFVELLMQKFPETRSSHLFGALVQSQNGRTTLAVHPYWDAMVNKPKQVQSVLSKLAEIANNRAGKGMSLNRLLAYVKFLNEHAEEGSMASSGSVRFAVAYKDYQLHSFSLDSILEYQLEKRRQQDFEHQVEHDREDRNSPRM
jgi:hypothetical protein